MDQWNEFIRKRALEEVVQLLVSKAESKAVGERNLDEVVLRLHKSGQLSLVEAVTLEAAVSFFTAAFELSPVIMRENWGTMVEKFTLKEEAVRSKPL